ncbi:MAG: hypothetical protein AB2L20_12650 [Mangrovibacterium sp.]
MLAILTIAMSMVYRELASLHIRMLLESGVKNLNKEKVYELYNFVYYKISKILKYQKYCWHMSNPGPFFMTLVIPQVSCNYAFYYE